jgi:FkbM family methyltransferase
MSHAALDMLRWRYRALRYRWKLERPEIRLVLEHLRPGDTALDVGGHKGAFTWWMRHAVGRSGRVDVFEPQPALAARLSSLVRERGWNNVRVEHLGVSDSPGVLPLRVPPGGPSPEATFERRAGREASGDVMDVPVSTIDDWVEQHTRRNVRLIKVDVEGHELAVFHGARRTLDRQRPALLFECERRHRPDGDIGAVFRFLAELGYRGQAVTRKGLLPLEQFDPVQHQGDDSPLGYINNFWFQSESRA